MNGASDKITFLQVFTILALMNGLATHVICNPMLLQASGRDAWVTVLVGGACLLLFSPALVWISRRSGRQKWQPWLARQTHPAVSWAMMVPICLQLYLIGAMTVIHTVSFNITNYLPGSSKLSLVLPLIFICCMLAWWGIRVIAIAAGVLLPIVIGLGIFVATSNTDRKDLKLLTPVLEHGWGPVMNGFVYIGGGLIEVIVLLLLQHRLKSKLKTWQLLLYSGFTIGIALGPIVGALAEFGPTEAAKQMISPYEQWRLVEIGQYVEHLDFFSIFQWMSGACVRISLAVFTLAEIVSLRAGRGRGWLILGVMASFVVLSMIPNNDYSFYLMMYRYYVPISFYTLLGLFVLWTLIALIAKPSQEGTSCERTPRSGATETSGGRSKG
ncbi:endospore germination permease [Cohnella sp. REN36]|uniref:endospore germination permease n=1 Tax=Cohnella sp. REN36 TaxID=2887347 RepID=UPI001D134877|nr:endospore germination permease [Cohnella sp. REN36]MCC3375344.1 endospore germination permease [Cohnella sp. REN36]